MTHATDTWETECPDMDPPAHCECWYADNVECCHCKDADHDPS